MYEYRLKVYTANEEFIEDVSLTAYYDEELEIYLPNADDWKELLLAYVGKNVVIVNAEKDKKLLGLDENGLLKLIDNDGANDYPNTLDGLLSL